MKSFRLIGMALVAMVLSFGLSSCSDDDEEDAYKDYPQLIVGKWFNFTPDASVFQVYQSDGIFNTTGWDKNFGWIGSQGTYTIMNNELSRSAILEDGSYKSDICYISVDNNNLHIKDAPTSGQERVLCRVQESFDIKGSYSYLNSLANVKPAAGKTSLQLPEGVTFNGQNSISIDAMHGERIINAMKQFFADATFADGGKLNHKQDGVTKEKSYTLNGNNLTFDLYEGLKLDAAQIAALEKEFMDTFETFTVILSLSKK